ncbi:hypothetical protein BACCAP_00444 [Pseudoflavonifractor capillosus ATCC 29799]|uniref:Uncharacterized protein n=1 Tax=Pseudoflavonifractor capillosus ATCC 29799 TaxID=411467 RepID=A6NQH4_9FIRM|nr:hypothetical protein BACCAP_00444 [Pseudoflavonifractor capillosus ATCC 29799]
MSEACHLRQAEGYEACEDAAAPSLCFVIWSLPERVRRPVLKK